LPDLSVVLCSLDGAEGVDRCLRALARQTIADRMEVVVVDDGSSDDTAAVARRHGVVVVRHEVNRGLAAARNTGIRASTGAIVAFLDDDCEPGPEWGRLLLAAYAPGVMGVGGDIAVASRPGLIAGYELRHNPLSPLEVELGHSENLAYRFWLYLKRRWAPATRGGRRPVYSLVGATMSFRRDALRDAGCFDERFTFGAEELDLCRRLARARPGEQLVLDPGVRVVHHFEPSLRDLLRRSRAYGRGSARMYRKWPDITPTFFPVPVLVLALLAASSQRRTALPAALALPLAAFAVATRGALAERRPALLLDPYLMLAQETCEDIGFLEGLWRYRHLRPEPLASHQPSADVPEALAVAA
jgi:glycosyltransferase involved in cell wall biosynthesis